MHLLYTLRAFERSIAAMGVGSTFVAISKSDLDEFVIPVPPLAEQKRIVAKVDELMALCDRLEGQQQERRTRHAALARASLARFADAHGFIVGSSLKRGGIWSNPVDRTAAESMARAFAELT